MPTQQLSAKFYITVFWFATPNLEPVTVWAEAQSIRKKSMLYFGNFGVTCVLFSNLLKFLVTVQQKVGRSQSPAYFWGEF